MDFQGWLKSNTKLADSSADKYARAARTISKEMLAINVISKPLFEMEEVEIDIAISLILFNEAFLEKDKRGNKMYSNALKQFRYYVLSFCDKANNVELELVNQVETNLNINETERLAIISARVGQGLFRKKLIDKYDSCVVTKVDNKKLLVASHIKPWSVSDNNNRISVENGLLLTPTYDKLFDSGLITFNASGKIFVSSFVGVENEKRLHIVKGLKYDLKTSEIMNLNLQYHNDVVFVK